MEIRYKKVVALYALLALAGILSVRAFIVRPVTILSEVHELRIDAERMRKDVKAGASVRPLDASGASDAVMDLMLPALDCIGGAGCCVVSGVPSKKKSPDDCPVFDIKIAFTGRYEEICKALISVDSLVHECAFDAGVQSCRIGAERSQDGRSWQLTCRETLQCMPIVTSPSSGRNVLSAVSVGTNPFFIPSSPRHDASREGADGHKEYYPIRDRESPQGRLVGRVRSESSSIVVVEIEGHVMHLRMGDGILLKDYGDSVKIVLDANDTLVLKK